MTEPNLSYQAVALSVSVASSAIGGVFLVFQHLESKINRADRDLSIRQKSNEQKLIDLAEKVEKNYQEIRIGRHDHRNQEQILFSRIEENFEKTQLNDRNLYEYIKTKVNKVIETGNRDRDLIKKLYRKVFNQDLNGLITNEKLTSSGINADSFEPTPAEDSLFFPKRKKPQD